MTDKEHDPLTEEEIEEIHRETGIAKKALRMIDKGMEEAKKGNVAKAPELTEEEIEELYEEPETRRDD